MMYCCCSYNPNVLSAELNIDSDAKAVCTCRLTAGMAAAQVMPFVRAIATAAPHSQVAAFGPARWQRLWQGRLVEDTRSSGAAPAAGSQWQDGGVSDDEEGGDAIELI